jgi:hypothetical protein
VLDSALGLLYQAATLQALVKPFAQRQGKELKRKRGMSQRQFLRLEEQGHQNVWLLLPLELMAKLPIQEMMRMRTCMTLKV